MPPPHSQREEPPWECLSLSLCSPAWCTCVGKRSISDIPGFGKAQKFGKTHPWGFGFDGSYFLLQQQAVRIPVASSTRNPEGWKHRVRSISQPMADEFHPKPLQAPSPNGGRELGILLSRKKFPPTQWHSHGIKISQTPKGILSLKKIK